MTLLALARGLAGRTLGDVASELGMTIPVEPRRAKGFAGAVLERALGASGSSRAEPDFPCGTELKTLPIGVGGAPAESTYVTRVAASDLDLPFRQTALARKLGRVLFVPVEASVLGPPGVRRIGWAFLWTPNAEDWSALESDFQEVSSALALTGDVSGSVGRCLQVRPKGRNARERARRSDVDGVPGWAQAKGYYLRPSFTSDLARRAS